MLVVPVMSTENVRNFTKMPVAPVWWKEEQNGQVDGRQVRQAETGAKNSRVLWSGSSGTDSAVAGRDPRAADSTPGGHDSQAARSAIRAHSSDPATPLEA